MEGWELPREHSHKETRRRKRTGRGGLGGSGPGSTTTVCAEAACLPPPETPPTPQAPAFRTTRRGKWSHSLVASSNLRGSHVRSGVPKGTMLPIGWVALRPFNPLLRVRSTQAPRATGNGSALLTPGRCTLVLVGVTRPEISRSWWWIKGRRNWGSAT